MDNLPKNIKKYIISRISDIFLISIFIGLLFLLAFYINIFKYGNIIGILSFLIMIIIFYFVSKLIVRKLDKWVVPSLDSDEQKKFLILDTIWSFIVISVVIFMLYPYANHYLLFGLFGFVFLYTEFKKWKPFFKIVDEEEKIIEEELNKEVKEEENQDNLVETNL
jgi:hypothetical protein